MKTVWQAVFATTAGTAFGAMLLFTGIVAEAAFRTLSPDAAGNLLAAIFPLYYTLTAILCGIAFLASLPGFGGRPGGWPRAAQAAQGIAAAALWVSPLWLLPAMDRIRLAMGTFAHAPSPLRREFFTYHGISMLLNIAAMVLTLFALAVWIAQMQSRPEWNRRAAG